MGSLLLAVVYLIFISFGLPDSLLGSGWPTMQAAFGVPYGLGAGAIDASVNHYVANHYPSSVMNFLHCFYGVGAMISPYIMSLALKAARWNEGYRWTAYIQLVILLVCVLSLPLWKKNETEAQTDALWERISAR